MKVYIAGPMRGIKDFNFPAFDRAETWLKAQNIKAINPAQHDRDGGFEGIGMTGHEPLTDREDFDLRETLKWDLEQVAHADAVAVLEGWERSSGARAEVALAHALGIPVAPWNHFYYDTILLEPTFVAAARIHAETPPSTNGEVRTTSATGGEKGQKLAQLSAIDPHALSVVAEVAGFGARKYSKLNFMRGYDWSLSYDALQRHLHAFWSGEDHDEESGLLHLGHAAWHCLAMIAFLERGLGTDDRYTSSEVAELQTKQVRA